MGVIKDQYGYAKRYLDQFVDVIETKVEFLEKRVKELESAVADLRKK